VNSLIAQPTCVRHRRIECGINRQVFSALIAALLLLCQAVKSTAADAPPRPPNIVMIISDDQGSDDYGFLGHPHIRTPHIDRLAEQSLTYRHAYVTSSLCRPSLATILSGQYPHQHRITSNDPPLPKGKPAREANRDPTFQAQRQKMIENIDRVATVPRLLQSLGYVSFQTGKWWEGNYKRGGFTDGMSQGGRHGDEGLKIGRESMQPVYDFIGSAVREQKPFFVWYAPMLPHTPHDPPQRLLDHYRKLTPSESIAKYWAMVEWFDETCGELLTHLDQQHLSDNTVVIYITDNGWIQDPDKQRFAPRSKQSQYNGGLRTPIMLRWPGHITAAMDDSPASSIDLAPTILSIAGLKQPAEMTGLNLLDRQAIAARPAIYGEIFTHNAVDIERPATSLRFRWCVAGNKKLIIPQTANEPTATPELYDLTADPGEKNNLAGLQPEEVARLRKMLDQWWAVDGAP
jgi:uncharacterized sulfatase